MTNALLLSASGIFTTDLIVTLAIGFIAGLLAQLITPGRGYGIISSIIIGIIGGWLGDKLFGFIHINTDIPFVNQIIRSALGAIILVVVLNLILGKDKRDKTRWKAV